MLVTDRCGLTAGLTDLWALMLARVGPVARGLLRFGVAASAKVSDRGSRLEAYGSAVAGRASSGRLTGRRTAPVKAERVVVDDDNDDDLSVAAELTERFDGTRTGP